MDAATLRRSLRAGLLGGIAAAYISMIGMVQAFGGRDFIVGVLSIGQALLLIVALVTGYLAADRNRRASIAPGGSEPAPQGLRLIPGSLMAGFTLGLFPGLLLLVGRAINLRAVLINVSPELLNTLSMGFPGAAGALVPVLLGAVLAGIGGAIFVLPRRPRRVLVTGLLLLAFMSLVSEVIRISLSRLPASFSRPFVRTTGLMPLGAALIFLVVVAISYALDRWGGRGQERIEALPPRRRRAVRYSGWGLVFAVLLLLPWIVGRVPSDVLLNVGIFMLLGFGLNIVVGKAGLLDLGYVAFFAVGAYAMAVLTSPDELSNITLSFWAALPIVVFITGLTGVLIGAPVLRMRGDYLAIVTLGFGEIARFLALSDWFMPVLGGAQGVIKIPNVNVGVLELVGPQNLYYLVLVFGLIALFISWRLEGSRVGRAWVAMREDETAAEAMGVNTVYYKLLAFAMGAMIASLGGAVFAVKLTAIFPHSFNVEVSITALSLLIIGGLGSLPGVVVGAFALVGLPELLREFEEFRLLIYGAVLIFMMLVRPQGLVPSVRRGRELTEEELAQDIVIIEAQRVGAPVGGNPSD